MGDSQHSGGLRQRFDGCLDVRPPLDDQQLGQIPARRGVFLLLAEGGQPVLLTTAASIRGRLRGRLEPAEADERKRSADLREVTRCVCWKLTDSHFEMDLAYLELARTIWPKTWPKLLSWRPAWLVHVDPSEAFPHFVRTADAPGGAGRYFGPFETGRSADHFIEIVQDAFDLCRDIQCLRRSPHGQRCSYGQMGRCLSPCDGSISMDDYRRMIAAATDFAAGSRQRHLAELAARMKGSAAALEFEQAAALKARLGRLAELDGPAFRHVAPAEEFRFLLLERSGSRKRVRLFLACRGAVQAGGDLPWPLAAKDVRRAMGQAERFMAGGGKGTGSEPVRRFGACPLSAADLADRWRMGLVARALFARPEHAGLVLRWRQPLTAEELAAAIEPLAAALGLSQPKAPKPAEAGAAAAEGVEAGGGEQETDGAEPAGGANEPATP
jgi:SAM-dependent methyltransferase